MAAHFDDHHRDGERQRDPKASRHVGKLGVRPLVDRGDLRLERHAADRAGSRPRLANLGVHRASVDGARSSGPQGLRRRRSKVLRRVGGKLFAAARRTEDVGFSGVVSAMLGGRGIDLHAADRIDGEVGGDGRSGRGVLEEFFRGGDKHIPAPVAAKVVGLAAVLRGMPRRRPSPPPFRTPGRAPAPPRGAARTGSAWGGDEPGLGIEGCDIGEPRGTAACGIGRAGISLPTMGRSRESHHEHRRRIQSL